MRQIHARVGLAKNGDIVMLPQQGGWAKEELHAWEAVPGPAMTLACLAVRLKLCWGVVPPWFRASMSRV